MSKYKIGDEFLLSKDVCIPISIEAKKGCPIRIIEIDHTDGDFPYKTHFKDIGWIYLSSGEIEDMTLKGEN